MAILVRVTLCLDVANEAEAADGANELLRELQRSFSPSSCLLDYSVDDFEEAAVNSYWIIKCHTGIAPQANIN